MARNIHLVPAVRNAVDGDITASLNTLSVYEISVFSLSAVVSEFS